MNIIDYLEKNKQASDLAIDPRAVFIRAFEQNWPPRKTDDYEFTPIDSFIHNHAISEDFSSSYSIEDFHVPGMHNIFLIDGVPSKLLPQIEGVTLHEIQHQINHFLTEFDHKSPLSNLHHVLTNTGLLIEVQKNKKVLNPIKITHLTTKPWFQTPSCIINIHAHAEVVFIEEFIDLSDGCAQISETIITQSAGSKLEHLLLTRGNQKTIEHAQTKVNINRDAKYYNCSLNLGGKLIRRNIEINLVETGANAEINNLYLTTGNEHSDINTKINHLKADTISAQKAKGILDQQSKGIFSGRIHIYPDAQRVNAAQSNKNLILSNKAQAFSKPQLEIFADDVKCSHGSTTGQLSDEEIFYFKSRGIPEDKARTMLAQGFGLEIINRIQNHTTHQYAKRMLNDYLSHKFQLGGLQ